MSSCQTERYFSRCPSTSVHMYQIHRDRKLIKQIWISKSTTLLLLQLQRPAIPILQLIFRSYGHANWLTNGYTQKLLSLKDVYFMKMHTHRLEIVVFMFCNNTYPMSILFTIILSVSLTFIANIRKKIVEMHAYHL